MRQGDSQPIQSELKPGERLLWSGRPRQGLVFRFEDIFLIPISLVWTVGMFVSIVSGKFQSDTSVPTILIAPFLLVGVYGAAGKSLVDILSRRRTYYGVTSKRVIIIDGIFDRNVLTFDLSALPGLSLRERQQGEGTIVFSDKPFRFGTNNRISLGPGWGIHEHIPEFDLIPEARKVYDLIRQQQNLATTAGNQA